MKLLLSVVIALAAAAWFTNAIFSGPDCDKDCKMGAAIAEQIKRDR